MNLHTNEDKTKNGQIETSSNISVDARIISSPVLKRLIEEVQFEAKNNVLAYNRVHNRHNRGR